MDDLPKAPDTRKAEAVDAVLPFIRSFFEGKFSNAQPNWTEFCGNVTTKLLTALFGLTPDDLNEKLRKL